ncbi:chromosome segregation protein SMC [Stakelama pacifica]|uniref:Chromosome partition protein Smc n=1 Tax=Stakelama pacifica TaxID=517720 RepID=A0A4R6FUW8_9SPHN|nr:chromosome segregation protein SMC [Stakelama pacifica]TDN85679.1 condensin subunit Smc [Stakelama pacifica]GGO91950.1 chromosome partition protein Smc [Stakelama pacifica]
MQIKRLRLSGFKSFVEPADLRIEPGLTGVVGPNGCGKSNLLEALRWAMGENSAKSMRGSGMEDVIFAGTSRRPQRDFAEVSILAEEVGGTDGDEVEIVRRIERGAGSAYRINGRDVRAKDVALLFADAATGAHSPALVSQGRISAVISAKPEQRRQMLEEAAGIAGLHVRRRDAEQRLRATETNLARLDEIIADQDSRAAALKRQARQAEKYRRLTDDIRIAEGRMIFARWRDAAEAEKVAKAEAKAADSLVAERAEAQEAAAAHQRQAAEALAEARSAAFAARDAANAARHRLEVLETERDTVRRRLAELDAGQARIAADREREGELARDASAAIARLTAEAKQLDQAIADAATRIPEADAALARAERESRDAEVALAQALAEQARESADARVAQAALAAARDRRDRAQRDADRVAAEIAALGDAAPLEAARDTAARCRADALTKGEAARDALGAADAAQGEALARQEAAQTGRAAAHAERAALESEAAALTKATRQDKRDRVLDRLTVAPGYERALAAALGDDLEAGLDPAAERHWGGAELHASDPAPPAGTQRLSDHVTAPEALARRLALSLVAETDAGQMLAPGQRLVTLAGNLRRWDGFVAKSGGAAAAERLERLNRLRAIEAALPQAIAAVEAADRAREAAAQTLAEARAQASAARTAIDAADKAAREALREEDRASAALERLAAQRSDLDERRARTRRDLDEADEALAAAQAALAALPDGSAMAERVRTLSALAESKRADVASARTDRRSIDRDLAQARERASAVAAEIRGWKSRAGEATRRIAEIDKREAELAREREALADKPEAIGGRIDAARAAVERGTSEAQASAHAEAEAEEALRSVEEKARTAAEALAEARERRAGASARAESQELRRVEMGRVAGERFECPPPLLPQKAGFDSASVASPKEESTRHEKLTLERERIGPVNLVAESELQALESASATNLAEREELGQAVNRLRGSIGTLNREGRQRLLAAFEAVDGHFQRLFTTLFNGGSAHLQLVDSDDPLEAGLEIMAQPPGKKLQSLTLLSGGEQALTAVALIFGLFLTNPAPICVLDEVDAPLDDANIDRFCDLLDRMTRETRTRYLIVTHNAATMSRMHRLFGVTMVEQGVSRLVSVDLGMAEELVSTS